MKYLLFVYPTNSENWDSDTSTEKLGRQLTDIISSDEVRFVYGNEHTIFKFESDLSIQDIESFLTFIQDNGLEFMYLLVQNPKTVGSNMKKDYFDHLMGQKRRGRKPKTTNPIKEVLVKITQPNVTTAVCNLTLDEILDKITEKGIGSLTKEEKNKLDEYSKQA